MHMKLFASNRQKSDKIVKKRSIKQDQNANRLALIMTLCIFCERDHMSPSDETAIEVISAICLHNVAISFAVGLQQASNTVSA